MRKELLGVPIDWINHDELSHKLIQFVLSGKPHQITTVNAEFIVIAQENSMFRQTLQSSDLSLADGTGVVLGQTFLDNRPFCRLSRFIRFLGLGVKHIFTPQRFEYKRITGVDLTNYLLALGAEEKWSFFLLGAKPGVAEKTGKLWQQLYPGITIVGTSAADPDDPAITKEIRKANPDILLVAYGAPKQDLFISEHREALMVPIMVGVGGTFDYAIGNVYRAPRFIRVIGLEWLVRLIQQPKRLRRIYRSTFQFSRMLIEG
jgi:N-acetylglucosaminyldiphosphoundecaprenol N-acetyl-beta-D-mannosaminyltransferase